MKKMPAVALSILLSPLLSLTSVAVSAATSECANVCALQPGRLETAREIKTEADAFVVRGRALSHELNQRIKDAERLTIEAKKLQSQALLLADSPNNLNSAPPISSNGNTSTTNANSSSGANNASSSNASTSGSNTATPSTDATKPDASAPSGSTSNAGTSVDAPAATQSETEKKLSGRASQLQTVAPPNIPLVKLKGPQLQQAMKQFNVDVEQFRVHAADYNKHLGMFRSQIGECQAAKNAFDALHKKYEMHCDAYHLNNIPPPHLCLEMNVSASEASSMANQLMSDQMRALRAEAQLNAEEGKLRELEGMQGKADTLVVKASDRARREREIAGEFGKLRQEYELLEIERKTIEASKGGKPAGPVARPYVSGQIKKGK